MLEKEFRVRHGLVVGNNVLVANVTTNTVSVIGTINAAVVQVNGTTIPSGATSNLIFNTVNTAFNVANAAFGSANNVAPQVAPAFNTANAAYTNSNTAFNVANAAFNSANNVAPQVAPSFNTANGAYTVANAAFGFANGVATNAAAAFGFANGVATNAAAAFAAANAEFTFSNTIYAAVNSAFGVINAAYTSSNADFTLTNAVFTQSNTDNVRLSAAYVSANANYVVTNAAFGIANSALAAANQAGVVANNANSFAISTFVRKSGDTITGDLVVQGNVTISGNTTYVNTQTLLIGDNILTLNADLPNTVAATENAGIEVNRGAFGNSSIIWDEGSDRWDVRANNSNLVSILSTGNVGIGTTSPSAKLHVSGGYTILADHNTQSVPTTTLGATALSWNYSGGSAEINFWNLWTSAVGGGFRFSQKTGTSTFNDIYWAANTSHIWYTTGTERMRIDVNGQVGINTNSPVTRFQTKLSSGNNVGFFANILPCAVGAFDDTFSNWKDLQVGLNLFSMSSGNIGIGNSSPTVQLHLYKATGTSEVRVQSGSSFGYMSLDSTGNYIGTGTSIPTIFTTNNTERMRIDTNGNVGIGTTSPTEKLHVVGNILLPNSTANTGALIGSGSSDNFTTDGVILPHYSLKWAVGASGGGSPSAFLSGYGGIRLFTGGTEQVRIIGGRVGIGSTNPQVKLSVSDSGGTGTSGYLLHVAGSDTATDPTRYMIGFSHGANTLPGNIRAGIGMMVSLGGGGNLIFETGSSGNNQTERMRITNTGNVGIGTTSTVNRLTVNGAITITNSPFLEMTANITSNYTINTGMNAITPGPVAIANNVTVTIPDGSYWSVT